MKGDFTRSTFKPKMHYSGVRMQQGRVQVDADFNEYVDIQSHLRHTALGDVIGLCGGPQDNAGFKITAGKDGLLVITKGRYYVDGILCENDAQVLITKQSDLPGLTSPVASAKGYYLAYLDVWQRHITALEDKDIREVALGGTDTTTRTKAVWQVKLVRAGGEIQKSPPLCSDKVFKTAWDAVIKPSSCLLTANVDTSEEDPNKPCIVPARAGYRGLENQLYRVEVHIDDAGKETFKWSRENGSVGFPITFNKTEGGKTYVKLNQLGKDKVLSLHIDDWVEVLGDTTELNCQPGAMAKVLPESNIAKGMVVLSCDVSKHNGEGNLKIRRWEQKETDKVLLKNGTIRIEEGVSFPLENGVMVKFEKVTGATYHTGDYWSIPARTATRDIDWPRDTSTPPVPLPQPPHGIRHHFCRLAVLSYDGTAWSMVHDCRRLFPPLTEMVHFHYVAGDGQEAMPGKPLPKPLQVSVVCGQMPVADATIRFKVVGGSGRMKKYKNEAETPCLDFTFSDATDVPVQTGADGIASACWRLDDKNLSQQVEATLLEIDGKPMVEIVEGKKVPFLPPIRFNANLSVAEEVHYDASNCKRLEEKKVNNVQSAIDVLCSIPRGSGCPVPVGKDQQNETLSEAFKALDGKDNISICLVAGTHEIKDDIKVEGKNSITITGCGAEIKQSSKLFSLSANQILLDNLNLQVTEGDGKVVLTGNNMVVERCRIIREKGNKNAAPLVLVKLPRGADSAALRWKNNYTEARHTKTLKPLIDYLLPSASVPILNNPQKYIIMRKNMKTLTDINPYVNRKDFEEALSNVIEDIVVLSDREYQEWDKNRPKEELNALPADLRENINNLFRLFIPSSYRGRSIDEKKKAIRYGIGAISLLFYQISYQDSLALETGIGGWIEDSVIKGYLSLHYDQKARYLEIPDKPIIAIEGIRKQLSKFMSVVADQVTLNLRGNNLYTVRSNGPTIMENIDSLINGNDIKDFNQEGYRSVSITENIFTANRNTFVCQSLIMNGNQFENDIDNIERAAYVFGNKAVFVGNIAFPNTKRIETFLTQYPLKKAANYLIIGH